MAGSLREALENAVADHGPIETVETPAAPIDKVESEVIAESERVGKENNDTAAADDKKVSEQTALERARDKATGQFKEGKAKPVVKPAPAPQVQQQAPQAPAPQAAAAPEKPKYPTTWKKGLEQHWETLPPEVVAEILRREGNYASGVSTYKQEWDRAKPLIDAIAPYLPELQRYNISPDKHIQRLFNAHQTLATAAPEQRLRMFHKLAQDYQVPLHELFVQGQDGKIYYNQNLTTHQQPAPQQQFNPADVEKLVDQRLSIKESNRQIDEFLSQTEKYPHGKAVAPTMAQILEANLADDLPSAYQAALRLPQHAALYEADQQQARATAEKAAAEAKKAEAVRARSKAVSVRSTTPTSVANAAGDKKSLRDTISANVEERAGGRV